MQYKDSEIFIGGLMRCCVATIEKFVEEHPTDEVEEGLVLNCMYEKTRNKQIIFKDGAFRWNRDEEFVDG